MANVTLYPMIDWYRTTLSQQYTWGTGSIYVNSVPWFTFPWGTTTMVTINAGKSNQQVVIIDGYNSSNKTLNVSSTTVSKWEWVNYTAQTHNVGSEVIISDNFFFWEKLVDAINSKVNSDGNSDIAWGNVTFSWDTTKYGISVKSLTTTQRDALSSPPDWVIIYNITSWVFQKREWWAWSDFGSWSVSNASTTVSGKVEKATSGEVTAWTATGWTGAELFVWPAEMKTVTDWLTTSINAKPSIATNAEAIAWTDTVKAVNPLQLRKYYWPQPIAWTSSTASSRTVWAGTSWTTYIQACIGTIAKWWTYTVSFDLSAWLSVNGYWRIYKNWVAFWTERSVYQTTSNFAENLTFVEWDTISLWVKSWGWWTASVNNLYVKYSLSDLNAFTIS